MNTALIKSFATKARTSLLQSVENRLKYWGINPDGNHGDTPQKSGAGYIYGGKPIDDPTDVPKLWRELSERIRTKEQYQDLIEEAAYTWFNRIMIIKIMEQNDLLPKILEYSPETDIPTIIAQAKNGSYSLSKSSAQRLLANYLMNNEDEKALGLIIKDLFESNQVLQSIFGTTPECYNLLLPSNLLTANGLIYQINVASGFDQSIYKEVELIGWIYQFYIADKKDEVFKGFKKNKKARAKDIPAATQIFTPKWIVKYMVENTVGKIYLDFNPQSDLRSKMKYLVESDQPYDSKSKSLISDITELTLLDPASGSGHILVEGFDLLMKMYREEGYSTKQAAISILENNLYGLDIDDRAMQLARFAVLLKASQYDPQLLSPSEGAVVGITPKIFAFPNPRFFNPQDIKDFLGNATDEEHQSFFDAIELLAQGKNIGSAIKLHLEESLIEKINTKYKEWNEKANLSLQESLIWSNLKEYIEVLLQLSKKYHAVVANPPYMGQKNMNPQLKDYVKAKYPLSKSDLFAVFMESSLSQCTDCGLTGMINQHSWMFLSSYEKLRHKVLNETSILNMLHLGPRTFDELSGEVVQSTAFVLSKKSPSNSYGNYIRLVDYKSSSGKEENFSNEKLFYSSIPQSNFLKIPGSPIAYWVSEESLNNFKKGITTSDFGIAKQGLVTANNDLFIRNWQEISYKKIGFNLENIVSAKESKLKWFPLNKAGSFRKWYGNQHYVVNFENDGAAMKKYQSKLNQGWTVRIKSREYYFKESISWGLIGAGTTTFREYPNGFIFDVSAITFYPIREKVQLLAYLNSKVCAMFTKILNPTLNLSNGIFSQLPVSIVHQNDNLIVLKKKTEESVFISKKDWDSRETSWSFERSPLQRESDSFLQAYQSWQLEVTEDFFKLQSNEEELNRIFIEVYGLQKQLTPEVELTKITILQEELDRKELDILEPSFREHGKDVVELPIDKSIVISQFISYCIGLSMGRYRLDKEGIQVAHLKPTEEELSNYDYNGYEVDIDDDAIIPLLGNDGNFPDDALLRTKQIILAIWGDVSHTENMNFLQECLSMTLDKWLSEKFWTYHSKTMYKKKPIYWLFCSNPKKPNKAAFKVLTYMHRMDKYTVQNIRTKYLHPHQEYIQSQIADLESNEASLSKDEAKKLDLMRQVWRPELMDYDDKLKSFANQQITFDLDDGVTDNYKLFEGVVAEIK